MKSELKNKHTSAQIINKFIIALVIFLVALLSSCDSSVTSKGKVHLITVGLDYQNTKISSLAGTIADATEFAACMSDIYKTKNITCQVHYMLQSGTLVPAGSTSYPTAENVLAAIRDLKVQENDLIIFFYSGHGEGKNEDFGIDEASLILATEDPDSILFSTMSMRSLTEELDKKACPAVLFLDCCYAGVAYDQKTSYKQTFTQSINTLFKEKDFKQLAIFSSCADDELSVVGAFTTEDGVTENHGYFTELILKELGWKHSSRTFETIYAEGSAINVYGYQGSCPEKLTVNQLKIKMAENWNGPSVRKQSPKYNSTTMDIYIIPEAK